MAPLPADVLFGRHSLACRLKAAPLKGVADWVEDYRRFWEHSLDRLEIYLQTLKLKEKTHGRKKR